MITSISDGGLVFICIVSRTVSIGSNKLPTEVLCSTIVPTSKESESDGHWILWLSHWCSGLHYQSHVLIFFVRCCFHHEVLSVRQPQLATESKVIRFCKWLSKKFVSLRVRSGTSWFSSNRWYQKPEAICSGRSQRAMSVMIWHNASF